MHAANGNGQSLGKLSAPRRNHYFYGKLMDEFHFQMEQSYGNRKRWLLNRLSLGAGVLCGLTVESQEGLICVHPGAAIDDLGREIIVPGIVALNPWQLSDDCGKAGELLSHSASHEVYICLAYRECTADYTPVLVADCNTQQQCAPGTIIESFHLLVHPVESDAPPPVPGIPELLCEALTKTSNDDDDSEISLEQRRSMLCEAALGLCSTPSEKPCICLAKIELLEGGTIGEIDSCTCRTVIFSNTLLLEMILCLAQRMDEYTSATPAITPPAPGHTPPPPAPEHTPPPAPGHMPPPAPEHTSHLKISRIQIIQTGRNLKNANAKILFEMLDPSQTVYVDARNADAIEVEFTNAPLDRDSVIAGQTFVVERVANRDDEPNSRDEVPTGVSGQIVVMAENRVRFSVRPEIEAFPSGVYRVMLVANGRQTIMSQEGVPLDGEPVGLPSGTGEGGGSFVFTMTIR